MTKAEVEIIRSRREEMLNGEWDPFEFFELVDGKTGKVMSPAGEMPSDVNLLSEMDYYIPGVVPPK